MGGDTLRFETDKGQMQLAAIIAPQDKEPTMFCPVCGKQNIEEAKYCQACGFALEEYRQAIPGEVDSGGTEPGSTSPREQPGPGNDSPAEEAEEPGTGVNAEPADEQNPVADVPSPAQDSSEEDADGQTATGGQESADGPTPTQADPTTALNNGQGPDSTAPESPDNCHKASATSEVPDDAVPADSLEPTAAIVASPSLNGPASTNEIPQGSKQEDRTQKDTSMPTAGDLIDKIRGKSSLAVW